MVGRFDVSIQLYMVAQFSGACSYKETKMCLVGPRGDEYKTKPGLNSTQIETHLTQTCSKCRLGASLFGN